MTNYVVFNFKGNMDEQAENVLFCLEWEGELIQILPKMGI